ncbi:hypothetical protein DM01DRAFT_1331429 [Hesseltinella vesiculosa]|uniref:PROP1-like PPR domain-containing protein n=1 Tax=Hesseltinella vesiculosa TaxID=101127 RepID=A0A1X2GV83_9FUNG|nr:hypothetical protein DM01DRAFT_1331429 [Hesseltinella vesiculosa]
MHTAAYTTTTTWPPATNTAAAFSDNPAWADQTSRIQTEKRSANSIWEEYTNLLNDPNVSLNEIDFVTVARSVKQESSPTSSSTSIKRLQSILRQLHQRQMDSGFVLCCNMLMHLYLENDDLARAKLIFDGMLQAEKTPSYVSINTLLDGISRLGTLKDVRVLINTLTSKKLMPTRAESWTRLIKTYGRFHQEEDAATVLAMLLKDASIPHDIECYNAMFEIYKQEKQPNRAWALYQDLRNDPLTVPDEKTISLLFSILKYDDHKERVNDLFKYLVDAKMTIRTQHYLALGWDPLRVLRHRLDHSEPALKTADYNILLKESVRGNRFTDALEIYSTMKANQVKMDVFTYAIFMDALIKDVTQPADFVFDLYDNMTHQDDLKPDHVIFNNLFMACARLGDADRAVGYLKEMETRDVAPNLYTVNSFLSALAQREKPDSHDVVLAKALWQQLDHYDVRPDARTYNNFLVLLARYTKPKTHHEIEDHKDDATDKSTDPSASPDSLQEMMALYTRMRQQRFQRSKPDFLTYAILINTAVTQGQIRRSMQLYRDAQLSDIKLNISSYNFILNGLAKDREYHTLLNVWYDMKTYGVKPDRMTYNLVLGACEQLHMTEMYMAVRKQRQLDTERLDQLERKREDRRLRSSSMKGARPDLLESPSVS